MICASWSHSRANALINASFGLVPMPTGSHTRDVVMVIGTPFLSVPIYVSDERAELAFDFIRSLVSYEVQDAVAKNNFVPTAHKEIGASEWFRTEFPYQYIVYTLR